MKANQSRKEWSHKFPLIFRLFVGHVVQLMSDSYWPSCRFVNLTPSFSMDQFATYNKSTFGHVFSFPTFDRKIRISWRTMSNICMSTKKRTDAILNKNATDLSMHINFYLTVAIAPFVNFLMTFSSRWQFIFERAIVFKVKDLNF